MTPSAANPTRIAELADQCVKCGLCVPLCPTYRVARTEAESPRGRIAFAAALAAGAEPSVAMREHLDQCLACMTCERVCPSHVRYGELIVETRRLMREKTEHPRASRLDAVLRHPAALRVGLRAANLVRPFVPARAVREAPRIPPKLSMRTQPNSGKRGRVGLFLGCVAKLVDRDVHVAATRLLAACGYDVVIPVDQGCCGALALHAGDVEGAMNVGASTRDSFVRSGVDTVLVSASGCFGTLRDHTFADTAIKARDIHEFLAVHGDVLRFKPLPKTVALHTPCTQANVAKGDGAIKTLLARIPEMNIAALPSEPRCCGAAGDYFLRHPHIADALRSEKLDQIEASRPDMLLTSNVGCRSFLDNGLRQRADAVPVVHPIVLLAQQLDN